MVEKPNEQAQTCLPQTLSNTTRSKQGASEIARDITERKHAEARENMLMAELTHINRVATAGVLSASIAHEVNQPLLSIAVNAETVRLLLASEKPDIDEARDALNEIVTASRRASQIITDLKSIFRKEPGDKFQVDINRVIRTVMGLVSADLRTLNSTWNSPTDFRPYSVVTSSCSR